MTLYPLPRFSIAERDRRWAGLRKLMSEENLKVVVVPANSGHAADYQANARYISHCGGGLTADVAVVFPLDGPVTVMGTATGAWKEMYDWVSDFREGGWSWGNVLTDLLHDYDLKGGRVGVSGLGPGTRTPDGTVLYQTMVRMLSEFPDTEFVDATDLFYRLRIVKSDEEVAALQKSNDLVDVAYQEMLEAVRPGVPDYEVWGTAAGSMLRHGSDYTWHSNWVSGRSPDRVLRTPSHRLLEEGDIILSEIESTWIGYRAQGMQPVCVGSCDPLYNELIKLQVDHWFQLVDSFAPGVTFREIVETSEAIRDKINPSSGPGKDFQIGLTIHGRGQGDDGPGLFTGGSQREPQHFDDPLEPNMVFIVKPAAAAADGSHHITWADTVVITNSGARRMGTREPGIWVG